LTQSLSLSRRIRRLARKFAPLRALGHWRSDRKFHSWKKANPGKSFADFYAADVEGKIRRGKHHFTLGLRGWEPRDHSPVGWDEELFASRGLEIWQQILVFGLEPQMRCVDYGCGSLRLGQHAMRYLEPGNYYGIDVVETFINEGLKLIDPKLLEEKRPHLGVIDDATLRKVGDWDPDFIFSNAVLQHVPPDELGLYFQRLASIMAPRTRAYVLFISAERQQRVKTMNWAYRADDLQLVIGVSAPSLVVEIADVDPSLGTVDGRPRKALCLSLV
jgi:hypothetical protein